ncbi:MAG: LAGLIDADG family homing endonuclease [Candidatus ainarchaeum sp.]|nr:LAGLIDADG family homing endonuclease [Candidatus ainarchaeum sp.]
MQENFSQEPVVLGRDLKDLEKYGNEGTAYLGKVVMSSGEVPVLGREILIDVSRPHLMLICGKRGGGKCVHGDTEILLEDGTLTKIKDLKDDSRKIVALNDSFKLNIESKDDFFEREVDKVLKIKTSTGREIILTPEHPLFTIDGWKPVCELQVGKRIAVPRKIGFFGNTFLTESQVKLIAYLTTEGHTRKKAVWFTNFDKKIQEDFFKSVKDFDERMIVKKMKNNEGQFRVVNSNPKLVVKNSVRENGKFAIGTSFEHMNHLRDWLISLGMYGKLAIEKELPKQVFSLSQQKTSLLLNRMFSCDGTIWREQNRFRIGYCSSSKKLIKQVQHLLLKFGIISTLRTKNIILNKKSFVSFEITIEGIFCKEFIDKIGFFGEKELKQKECQRLFEERKFNANKDTIPKEIWDYYKPENWSRIGKKIGYKNSKALRTSINYSPTREKLLQIAIADENELIQLLAESDIYWDEIKSIEEVNEKTKVYDISVPKNHNFVANDIIIHNSYTLAVLMEEMARLDPTIKNRVSTITIDTVGIFWGLKLPAGEQDKKMLDEWNLKSEQTNVKVFVPQGQIEFYKEKGLPIDGAFTLKCSELEETEWMALFRLDWMDPQGILISRTIQKVREKIGTYYGIDDLISAIKNDVEAENSIKQSLVNRLQIVKSWGLIEKNGTKIQDLAQPGAISVVDVSAYRQTVGAEGVKDIVVALIGKKLFEQRMLFRKEEEIKLLKENKRSSKMPLVWLMIDEAHMFMPKDEKNIALPVLLEWVRVGRQPGLGLILATQRPEKIHPDAISQCDIFISHRMTSQPDIMSVGALRPTYMSTDLDRLYSQMPKQKGFALIIDDNTEKVLMIKVRPRFSWDSSVTASAFLI